MNVVYCGGCNPQIDRRALVDALHEEPALADLDMTVYVSGCARACASGRELTIVTDNTTLVVAGECLDARATQAAELVTEIKRKLQGAADGLED